MATVVKWNTFADADVDEFHIYRAITGILVSFPNSLEAGDKLVFAATSPTIQTVTLTNANPVLLDPPFVTIDSVLADINAQAKGLKAKKNAAEDTLLIRCTARENPKLKLFSCPFLAHTGQTARLIGPKTEFVQIGTEAFNPSESSYSFSDPDGDPTDWYHITALKDSIESIASQDQLPMIVPADLCVLEGRVIDHQNNPVVGAEVRASVSVPTGISQNAGIVTGDKLAVTDSLGRWSLPLIQDQEVLLQIPSIGYNSVIRVPVQSFALFKDLVSIDDHYFNPAGET